MAVLLDTNVLLRLMETRDPSHLVVRRAIRKLTLDGEALFYSPQNLVEFWCACTRPVERNGYGLTPAEAEERASILEEEFRFLADNELVHSMWRHLVRTHSVSGLQVYDARIAAFMLVHRVENLLTLNGRDFSRYPGVSILDPQSFGKE